MSAARRNPGKRLSFKGPPKCSARGGPFSLSAPCLPEPPAPRRISNVPFYMPDHIPAPSDIPPVGLHLSHTGSHPHTPRRIPISSYPNRSRPPLFTFPQRVARRKMRVTKRQEETIRQTSTAHRRPPGMEKRGVRWEMGVEWEVPGEVGQKKGPPPGKFSGDP